MTLPAPHRPSGAAFTYDAPVLGGRAVRVVFGIGTMRRVGDEARSLGGPALLIAGPHEDDAADVVGAQLGGRLVGRLRDVAQHVPVELAAGAVARARELGARGAHRGRRRVGDRAGQGGGAATPACRSSRCRPPTPAAR